MRGLLRVLGGSAVVAALANKQIKNTGGGLTVLPVWLCLAASAAYLMKKRIGSGYCAGRFGIYRAAVYAIAMPTMAIPALTALALWLMPHNRPRVPIPQMVAPA